MKDILISIMEETTGVKLNQETYKKIINKISAEGTSAKKHKSKRCAEAIFWSGCEQTMTKRSKSIDKMVSIHDLPLDQQIDDIKQKLLEHVVKENIFPTWKYASLDTIENHNLDMFMAQFCGINVTKESKNEGGTDWRCFLKFQKALQIIVKERVKVLRTQTVKKVNSSFKALCRGAHSTGK